MSDNVLKIVSLVAFIATLIVLGLYVPDPSLIAVLVIVSAMAIYDFFLRPYLLRNGRRL